MSRAGVQELSTDTGGKWTNISLQCCIEVKDLGTTGKTIDAQSLLQMVKSVHADHSNQPLFVNPSNPCPLLLKP